MPTIELVSIDCPAIPALPRYPSFAYQVEPRLISHRALFQPVFDTLSGVIVHLGNTNLEGEAGCWCAGMLMDWSATDGEWGLSDPAFASLVSYFADVTLTDEEHQRACQAFLGEHGLFPTRPQVLRFLPEVRSDLEDLLQRLLDASPRHRLTFSTDYQFGGEPRECGEITRADFLTRHDHGLLQYNSLYFLRP